MKTRDFIESFKKVGVKIDKIVIREYSEFYPKIFLETTIDEYWTELENNVFKMYIWQVIEFEYDINSKVLILEV